MFFNFMTINKQQKFVNDAAHRCSPYSLILSFSLINMIIYPPRSIISPGFNDRHWSTPLPGENDASGES